MNRFWTVVGAGLTALALTSFAIYFFVDQAISFSYLKESLRTTESGNAQLKQLIAADWEGLSENEVLHRLRAATAKSTDTTNLIKREPDEGFIWFGNARFEFKDGRLVAVR
jgi:hypothetical protein